MNILVDESKLAEVYITIERINVLAGMLQNEYFDKRIDSMKDVWQIAGPYYEDAGVLNDIILNFSHDAKKLLDAAYVDKKQEASPVS